MILQIADIQGTTEYKLENFGKGTITFGRNTDQDIVLQDINVSRCHGFIYKAADGWHISDNASTNGIVHNSEIISDRLLRTNDVVVLSIKNQDRAVQMRVIDDEYNNATDRVADARSTSRYFRMTTGTTDVLEQQLPLANQAQGFRNAPCDNFVDTEKTMLATEQQGNPENDFVLPETTNEKAHEGNVPKSGKIGTSKSFRVFLVIAVIIIVVQAVIIIKLSNENNHYSDTDKNVEFVGTITDAPEEEATGQDATQAVETSTTQSMDVATPGEAKEDSNNAKGEIEVSVDELATISDATKTDAIIKK